MTIEEYVKTLKYNKLNDDNYYCLLNITDMITNTSASSEEEIDNLCRQLEKRAAEAINFPSKINNLCFIRKGPPPRKEYLVIYFTQSIPQLVEKGRENEYTNSRSM